MSTYVREKVMRTPIEYSEIVEIDGRSRSLFGYGDVGKFQIAPTEESYIDYVIEYEENVDSEYGKTRALYPREQEKYRPIWQQILVRKQNSLTYELRDTRKPIVSIKVLAKLTGTMKKHELLL